MIITISGKPGAGKTTCAKILAERLGSKHYSIGDMRGKLAESKGLTIDGLNELDDPNTHREVDEFQEQVGKKENNFVMDGWLSWLFIPHAVNIFFDVDPDVAAKRIFSTERSADEPKYKTTEECKKIIEERYNITRAQTMKLYDGADLDNKANFDFVIDTTNLTQEEVLDKITEKLK
ncbi:cytidylate kinase family protein [Nanoarchaeota archaeon]